MKHFEFQCASCKHWYQVDSYSDPCPKCGDRTALYHWVHDGAEGDPGEQNEPTTRWCPDKGVKV